MDPKQRLAQIRASIAAKLAERATHQSAIDTVRTACETEQRDPNETEAATVAEARAAKAEIDRAVEMLRGDEAEAERDVTAWELSREYHATGAVLPGNDTTVRVGQEPRTYSREKDPKGVSFLRDVGLSAIGNGAAINRLNQHMHEEEVERGQSFDRAAGTAAFSGLVVPQYLTDLFAPKAKAGRPFADACTHHDLPETGMTVNLSAITTSTSTAVQTEAAAVSETDIDDTLVTINVQTNAGQQTLSRQAIERGVGVDDTTLDDLFRSYATTLDSTLLNQATNGLTNVASSITYTSASPTIAELYPKLLAGPAGVEAALMDQAAADVIAVMHSRRWYWINAGLSSSFPLLGQPGMPPQLAGANYGEAYGSGFRGVLPNGTPVIVDNNVTTSANTNQDEIYFGSRQEFHLWEDPSAPMLIRAEQTKAANLQVLFVVYGYFAYTHARRSHAQKIAGTGLATPTF